MLFPRPFLSFRDPGDFNFMGGVLPPGAGPYEQPTDDFDGSWIDATGVMQYASGPDELRWEHRWDGAAFALAGLLNEPERTNIVQYSEAMDSWVQTNVATTADAAVAPDGATTADEVIANTTYGQHRVSRGGLFFSSGDMLCLSGFERQAGASLYEESAIWLGGGVTRFEGNFNVADATALGTHVVGAPTDVSARISRYGSEWVRPELSGRLNGGVTSSNFLWWAGSINGAQFAGDNASGFDMWGAQVEVVTDDDPRASSYIPNTASSGSTTRAAGVLPLDVPDGTYDITITRFDGVEPLLGEVVSGGFLVPTSTSPLQRVQFAR